MLHEYRIERMKKLESFDVDVEKARIEKENPDDGDLYPRLCGVLQFWVKEATETARDILDELLTVTRRKDALEWAAESVLKGEDISTDGGAEVYEVLYAAADVIEHALKEGWSDDKLRILLRENIKDDEIEAGRFIDQDERCVDCDEFIGEEERCEECQENYDDAQKGAAR